MKCDLTKSELAYIQKTVNKELRWYENRGFSATLTKLETLYGLQTKLKEWRSK